MIKHKQTDRLCCLVIALTLVVTLLFVNGEALGVERADRVMGYETRLFDDSRVHTLDIVIDDWAGFLETCTNEEYVLCHVIIDGESYKNVGLRAKGNTSLSQVASYGNDRYSLKIEFDQYNSMNSYHGLDKLCLNNLIQDNTYLKDYLTYTMMREMGVAAPLCSFVWITVGGEDWGLYLAVEGVEDAFLQRNYGNDYGELYKPDSMSMGGGRGNGRAFNMEEFAENFDPGTEGFALPEGFDPNDEGFAMPEGFDPNAEGFTRPENFAPGQGQENRPRVDEGIPAQDGQARGGLGNRGGGLGGGMGSEDVKLKYIDDDPDSYPNIFGNAKTDLTEADQNRLIASLQALGNGETEGVVDVDAVIRYLVVHNFVDNGDSYTGTMVHNYYLYEKDGALSLLPWDYNLAFGSFNMGGGMGGTTTSGLTASVNAPIDSPVSGGALNDRPMVAWIFESEEYTALYHQVYAQFISEFFDSGVFAVKMAQVIDLITPYVQKEPAPFCTFDEFVTGSSTLVAYGLLRAESVSGQLAGTIPATTEGQTADNSAFVDASHLSASDMGGMGGGMGGGRGGFGGGQGRDRNGGASFGAGGGSTGDARRTRVS